MVLLFNLRYILFTAFSRFEIAKSVFFVCAIKILPNCTRVRVSIFGANCSVRILCKQCIQSFIFGGFDVLKFSAKPRRAT